MMWRHNAVPSKTKVCRLATSLPMGLMLILLIASVALAQGAAYSISRWSFAGIYTSTGGSYELRAIAGQPGVSEPLAGSAYTLIGGFRPGVVADTLSTGPLDQQVFLPLVVNNR